MKMETLAIIFIVGILVFIVAALFTAIRLMPVITNRLAKVALGEKRPLKTAKFIALLALLALFCLFNGCVASCCSGFVTVAKDYTSEATVGVASLKGFPIWFDRDAPWIRIGLIPNRVVANWGVWTTVFMLICCGIYFKRTRSRLVLPAGIVLVIGCAGAATFLVLTAIDWSLPYNTEIWVVRRALATYARENNGEFPASLKELTKPTKDGKPPLLNRLYLRDSWGKRIQYERKGNGFTLRSSGPDRVMGTGDDVTLCDTDDEYRQGENR